MTIRWRKYLFSFIEYYGRKAQRIPDEKADIHIYFQQQKPIQTNKKLAIHRQVLHLCIDLRKNEEQLLRETHRKTRYKIRRAERDHVRVEYNANPNLQDIKTFANDYNTFAARKGIQACKLERLISLMENNMLVITSAYHPDGSKLVANAIIANRDSAIGLYSASSRLTNKTVSGQYFSRANRYLNWCEYMYFKQLGYHTFDLMGLTMDPSNQEHQNINQYKRGFGGKERIEYQSIIPQTLKGTTLLILLKIIWRKQTEILTQNQVDHMLHPSE